MNFYSCHKNGRRYSCTASVFCVLQPQSGDVINSAEKRTVKNIKKIYCSEEFIPYFDSPLQKFSI